MTQALGPTQHSVVGMSVLSRRLECPGSANAERGLPDVPTAASSRGTDIHEAAAKALVEGLTGEDVWDEPEGIDIIDDYLDVVLTLQAKYKATLLVEHRFHLVAIHPELFGTADAVLVGSPHGGEVVVCVVDLKTGRWGVEVRREDGLPNLQLSGYGLGGIDAVPDGVVVSRLELHVVQPLNGGHKQTSLDPAEIFQARAEIAKIVNAAMAPDAPRYAGEWCKFCKAASACPALRGHSFSRADLVFDAVMDDPVAAVPAPSEMSHINLSKALAAAETLELWISAVRQKAAGEIRAGGGVQGWKLVQRQGKRKWRDETFAERYLVAAGVAAFNTKLKSPAQAEAAAKKIAKETGQKVTINLASLTVLSDPGTALVQETDPRPAIRGSDEVFDVVEIDPLS